MPAQKHLHVLGLPGFKQLVFYTGNILRTSLTQIKYQGKTTNKELINAIQEMLWISLKSQSTLSYQFFPDESLLEVRDLNPSQILDDDELQITVKLFYTTDVLCPNDVDKAIEMLQKLLGATIIDTFVLSSFISSSPSVKKTWKSLESYHHQGIIRRLGVSDYSEQQLAHCLASPEFVVKPTVNQVNHSCCNLPTSMVALAKRNGVDLLYTSDCKDILSRQELTLLCQTSGVIKANQSISPRWVLKYNVFDKARSVVANKGYIVSADMEYVLSP